MKLTRYDYIIIRDFALRNWEDHGEPEGGNCELFVQAFLTYLKSKGFDLISPLVKQRESQLIETGSAKEYLSALIDGINKDGVLTEEATLLLLVLATSEDRQIALNKVMSTLALPQQNKQLPRVR